MRILSYPLDEYLALTNDALFKLRTHETTCAMSEMERARVRLFTFVAPTEHCWGMDFSASATYSVLSDRFLQQKNLLKSVSSDIKASRRRLSDIALGLLPFGSDAEGDFLEYGSEDNGLQSSWFRSLVLPMDDFDSDAFFSLWEEHERQLGKFFVLPYPDSRVRAEDVDDCLAASRDVGLLFKLFLDRHGAGGNGSNELVSLLREYQIEAKARELDTLLNPEFLLQEYVRWSMSLVPPISVLQKLAVVVYDETFGTSGVEGLGIKTEIAILRLRIARMLQWPLGVRLLARQVEPYAGHTSKSALLAETALYVSSAIRNYPVLVK